MSAKAPTRYTEHDARRAAQERANREHASICIYRGLSLGCDVWYVRASEAAPPYDAPLFARIAPQTVCPNCGQWQDATTGDCLHECRKRGFV